MPKKVVVICGPTASGKTALGAALGHALNGEVVSADSMQIYRGMDIGTAKPTNQEMDGVPHHMLDVADPAEDFSAARYVELAVPCVEEILKRGKVPLIVGGTGLYIDSILSGREFAPFRGQVRERLQERARQEGMEALHAELKQIDPQRGEKLHLKDEKRILRALEVYYETGKTMTEHDRESKNLPPRYEAVRIFLNFEERADLWRRIDRRVDEMMERGLADEVRRLLHSGVPPQSTAMQAIGYKELCAALRGEEPLENAVAEVKLRSRQYAKRQVTWFRKCQDALCWQWGKNPDFSACLQASTEFVKANGIG